MHIRIRITALLLVSVLLPGCLPAVSAQDSPENPFSDVAQDKWYYEAVCDCYENGLFSGITQDRFAPDGTMTRAMLVTVLWRCADRPTSNVSTDGERAYSQSFSDVATNSWYGPAVAWASSTGLADGIGNNRFAPDAAVTREQAAVLLYRFAQQRGADVATYNDLTAFSDTYTVHEWARDAISWAVQTGLLQGSSTSTLAQLLQPRRNASRAQLAAILMRFLHYEPSQLPLQTFEYGVSGSGQYPLTACKLGDGKNVMVLTFALHGWEDNFDRDGAELVYLADCVKNELLKNSVFLRTGDWTVYLIRCANPDGLYLGTSSNGPGRCTVTYQDEYGIVFMGEPIGIDINRCFPYRFEPYQTARNYNGTAPLQCVEAKALAAFMQDVKGDALNVCIDTHGWYNQTITSSGKGALYKAFTGEFPESSYASLSGSHGYFSAWAAYELGYDSCLFELPDDVKSSVGFVASGYIARYEAAILHLLMGYYRSEPLIHEQSDLEGN